MAHPAHHFSVHSLLRLSKRRKIKILDTSVYIVGLAGNLAVVPQAVKAWSGPTPGLAISTWVLFTFVSLIWLTYAIVHKQKPLIFAQLGGLVVNALVVTGWLVNNL